MYHNIFLSNYHHYVILDNIGEEQFLGKHVEYRVIITYDSCITTLQNIVVQTS